MEISIRELIAALDPPHVLETDDVLPDQAVVIWPDGQVRCPEYDIGDLTGGDPEVRAAVLRAAELRGWTSPNVCKCEYCGRCSPDVEPPAIEDDAAWSSIAADHARECLWVLTRAGQISVGRRTRRRRD